MQKFRDLIVFKKQNHITPIILNEIWKSNTQRRSYYQFTFLSFARPTGGQHLGNIKSLMLDELRLKK